MNNNLNKNYGRPNRKMARVVHEALVLFHLEQRDAAIALFQQNDIPLHVVERVILRRGPRRKTLD
jgi:hypothetical protein